MVNQTANKRHQILELLFRAEGGTLSGVRISEETGISRVAVWKHISALKESGFNIESRAKGYMLADPDDLLLPFCFEAPHREKIHHFQEVGTTMDEARKLARQGAPHMSCVVAEHQAKGRGRLNRQWDSGRGGLWFTLVLKPDTPPPLAYLYNFAASLSLSLALEKLFGLDVRVKWPNDLLLDGKKLVGLLSEMETQADMIRFLLMGIGINVNNMPDSDAFSAISLAQVLGRPLSRKKVLAAFLDEFRTRTRQLEKAPDPGRLIAQWKQRTSTIGTRVRVQTLDRTIEGLALDVDDTGALLVEDSRGDIKKIIYGDCFHS